MGTRSAVVRGQDSNLRTDKDCDLNAAPLTKLGDPRGGPSSRSLFMKQQSGRVHLFVWKFANVWNGSSVRLSKEASAGGRIRTCEPIRNGT